MYQSVVLQLIREEYSLSDIIHKQQTDQTEHFLKYCLFLSAKHKKAEVLKEICKLMKEHLTKEKIEEILNFELESGLFSKSLINYCNENSDMASCMELIQFQRSIHDTEVVGLNYLRNQNPRGPLTNWILKTYSQLYANKTSKISTILQVLILVGFLSYGLNVYDIYSDVQLYREYSKYSISIFDESVQRCQRSEIYNLDESHSTFETACNITLAVLLCSAVVYVLNIWKGRAPIQLIDITDGYCSGFLNKLLIYPLLPFLHMYFSYKQMVATKKTLYQENIDRFRVLLNVLKNWEVLENNIQFIVSLWAARHFTPCLLNNGFQGMITDSLLGLFGLLTFGYLKADFIQVLLGKLLLTTITSFLSLALLNTDKPGETFPEKVVNALVLFFGYMFIISSRLCGLYSIIFLSNVQFKYQIFLGLHFLLTLMIIIIFEKSFSFYTVLRVFSSYFVLQSEPKKNEVTYTFVSQSLYQIVCLIEDLTLVLIMHKYNELYSAEVLKNINTRLLIWIVIVGRTVSVVLQVICRIVCLKHNRWNHK